MGIVIGSAIFETPALVAANTGSVSTIMFVWILGAVISAVGALCYAELSATYPDPGGDYHFLYRAWGRNVSFLYGWARMTVIQTGSIALIAFVFGDYASQIFRLGMWSPAIYAAALVVVLTALHLAGVHSSRRGMFWLMAAQLAHIKSKTLLPKDPTLPDVPIVRAMPNTAVLIGESMTCLAAEEGAADGVLAEAEALFDLVGRGLLIQAGKQGRAYIFRAVADLAEKLAHLADAIPEKADTTTLPLHLPPG